MARQGLPRSSRSSRPARRSPRAKLLGVPDLLEIAGLETAKRALEVALAGGHHLLLAGPSGVGKTMLARSVPALLPPLAPGEAKALGEIYRLAGQNEAPRERRSARPTPEPRHGTSSAAREGGPVR